MTAAPPHHHRGDGDGWVECALGHRHWGRFGAAGLLLRRSRDGVDEVLLQHRAPWSHHGDTWGLLGGARNSEESPVTAALREAVEEGGLDAAAVRVHGRYDEVHGGWSYVTVLADARSDPGARAASGESVAVSWVPADEVSAYPLHPGFAGSWPVLRDALRPVTVVVDAANVVGSRPDGWWRDREGAARRLIATCAILARDGLVGERMPEAGGPPLQHWWPRVTVVVEGAARAAADAQVAEVRVVAAHDSGDDGIVSEVADAARAGSRVVVVTADRGLRARCAAYGAAAVGPRWLTRLTG